MTPFIQTLGQKNLEGRMHINGYLKQGMQGVLIDREGAQEKLLFYN